ncbi:hypothetical protein Tco_0222084 [Tanacetum coccineum]
MTTLKYSDKHNMVAFLKKPNESVGFTEIVDFLKGTSLRYASTHNPTIYDSLVKRFWQTATVRTLANGTPELVAYIANKEYTITEASVRSKLQLADVAGISNLPDAEIYDGLATLGVAEDQGEGSAIPVEPQHTPTDPGPTFTHVADEATTTGVRVGTEGATTTTSGLDAGLDSGNIHESLLRSYEAPLHEGHTSGSAEDSLQLKELMVLVPTLVTRIANLEKELHQIKTTYRKAVLTLVERVKSLEVALKRKTKKVVVSDSEIESNEGKMIQDFVTPYINWCFREVQRRKIISLTTLEAAKTLSQVISQKANSTDKGIRYKRKTRSKLIEKDISTDLDAGIEFNPDSKDFNTGNEDFNTGSLGVSTGSRPVSTPSLVQTINVTIPFPINSQREGKSLMTTEEIQATKRTKAQIQQEEAEEEELSEQQKKRKVEVQEATQFYTEEDWDTIRAKLEANAELTKSLQRESMTSEDFAKRMVEMINQKKKFYAEQKAKAKRIKRQGVQLEQEFSKKQKTIEEVSVLEESITEPVIAMEEEIEKSIKKKEEREAFMKDKITSTSLESEIGIDAIPSATKPPTILIYFSRDDLIDLYKLVIKKYGANRLEEMYDRVLWGDLKTMFDPPLSDDAI